MSSSQMSTAPWARTYWTGMTGIRSSMCRWEKDCNYSSTKTHVGKQQNIVEARNVPFVHYKPSFWAFEGMFGSFFWPDVEIEYRQLLQYTNFFHPHRFPAPRADSTTAPAAWPPGATGGGRWWSSPLISPRSSTWRSWSGGQVPTIQNYVAMLG